MPSPLAAALAALLAAHAPPHRPRHRVDRVADLVSDAEAQRLAAARGLQFVDVLWEDTGRVPGLVGRPQHQRRHHRGGQTGTGQGPPRGAHAGPALPRLRRPDRRREARPGLAADRQPARRRRRAGGHAARLPQQPRRATSRCPANGAHPGRHAARPARHPRAGLGAGRLPAGAARRQGHLRPGHLQLPVDGGPPRGADHPGDAPGHLDDHRRQRPRHRGRPGAGGSGSSSTPAASGRRSPPSGSPTWRPAAPP